MEAMANGNPSRPRYEAGSYLTAADCQAEQSYRLQRLRRHNRYLHGWGVVCGLWVLAAGDPARPWTVVVCPGYALGPYGDEIEVRRRASLDVRGFLWRQTAIEARLRQAYVVIRYREQLDRLAPIPAAACECEEPEYGESRIGDGYELAVIFEPPDPVPALGLCARQITPCPDCPESPWLALARILLPASTTIPIRAVAIDNGIRRTI
jgi:hypothetical protein